MGICSASWAPGRPSAPPLVVYLHGLTPASASGNEGSSGALPLAPTKNIAGGRRDVLQVGLEAMSTAGTLGQQQAEQAQRTGEQAAARPTQEQSATWQSVGELTAGETLVGTPTEVQQGEPTTAQQDAEDSDAGEAEGEQSDAGQPTDSGVVEVSAEQPELQRSGRVQRPPERLTYHVCLPAAAFTTLYDNDDDDLAYDDAENDEEFPELDLDMHADPEHRWDIATMTVKEALASWKGTAVNAAMDEEIRSLIGNGT
ncbi:unnamed protein product [Closterium sp. Yama58-4]|nr:unnamed protein product [Closterium sp. Yama58-4]